MTGDAPIYHAVLVFTGARQFDRPAMRRDIEAAFRATEEWRPGATEEGDPTAVPGRTVCARFDVFAPTERGGTVPEDECIEGLEVFAEAYPDLAEPRSLVSIQVFPRDPDETDDLLLSAVLAQVVDLLVERTEADFVRLPGRSGLMTGARFKSEFRLARSAAPGAPGSDMRFEEGDPDGCAGAEIFPDIDLTEARLDREWRRQNERAKGGAGDHDGTGSEIVPVEARLATWAVNASVAIFAPPVGASLAVYNLLRGEDFRLNAHALALTGTFMALAASGQGLSDLALLL